MISKTPVLAFKWIVDGPKWKSNSEAWKANEWVYSVLVSQLDFSGWRKEQKQKWENTYGQRCAWLRWAIWFLYLCLIEMRRIFCGAFLQVCFNPNSFSCLNFDDPKWTYGNHIFMNIWIYDLYSLYLDEKKKWGGGSQHWRGHFNSFDLAARCSDYSRPPIWDQNFKTNCTTIIRNAYDILEEDMDV